MNSCNSEPYSVMALAISYVFKLVLKPQTWSADHILDQKPLLTGGDAAGTQMLLYVSYQLH